MSYVGHVSKYTCLYLPLLNIDSSNLFFCTSTNYLAVILKQFMNILNNMYLTQRCNVPSTRKYNTLQDPLAHTDTRRHCVLFTRNSLFTYSTITHTTHVRSHSTTLQCAALAGNVSHDSCEHIRCFIILFFVYAWLPNAG